MMINSLKINDEEFNKFQEIIESRIGIKFPETKKSLIESRISGHISKLGFKSFNEYYEYLLDGESEDEIEYFIDKITTHTTQFFREDFHFEFLEKTGIDLLNRNFNKPVIKVLSLGSSTGEEMYSIAMLLTYLQRKNIIRGYEIHGADISKYSLLHAKSGAFKKDHLKSIPSRYKEYFDLRENRIEAKPFLKNNLRFFILNACKKDQIFPDNYHVVFCRNMLIYFNKSLQQNVIDNISNIILKKGLIFIGHSESLFGLTHPFIRIAPTVYQKD